MEKFEIKKDELKFGYDMIIQMKSIFDLQRNESQQEQEVPGLKVQQYNQQFDPEINDVIVVGLQGKRNSGKTFLLKSLIHEDLPSDYHVSTPGVCIKQHEVQGKKVVYVNSDGHGNPVKIDYMNNLHYQNFIKTKRQLQTYDEVSQDLLNKDTFDKYNDIKACEQIKREFIVSNSKVLITTISQVTNEDQKLIHEISEQLFQDEQKKVLIVVHNLKDYYQSECVQEYIQNTLKKAFPVKELVIEAYDQQKDEENFKTIFFDEVKPHILHIVMAHENSEAGRKYNNFALYYLKQMISMYQNLSTFNIREKLQDYLNQNLYKYIDIKSYETDDSKQYPSHKEFLEYCEESQKIVLKKGFQIEKIKEFQMNIFGSLFKNGSYSIVKLNENKQIHLFVEIPGTVKYKRFFDKPNGKFYLQITVNKQQEEEEGQISVSTRNFDEKHLCIEICKEKELWKYKQKENEENLNNGIYKFLFIKEKTKGFR